MRVVFGAQFVAPRHVSRMNTWRKPLLLALAVVFNGAGTGLEEWPGVMARNATKRPEELMEGRMLSVPTSVPFESVEMSCVDGLHDSPAPAQGSRTYICLPGAALS